MTEQEIKDRIAELQRKCALRRNARGYEDNVRAIETEIERLKALQ